MPEKEKKKMKEWFWRKKSSEEVAEEHTSNKN